MDPPFYSGSRNGGTYQKTRPARILTTYKWYNRAIRSRIEPLKKFARRLKEYLPGILAHCRRPHALSSQTVASLITNP